MRLTRPDEVLLLPGRISAGGAALRWSGDESIKFLSTGRPDRGATKGCQFVAIGVSQETRDLTPDEIAQLGDETNIPAWAAARALLALDGITATSIAAISSIALPTVHQRLRRHPG